MGYNRCWDLLEFTSPFHTRSGRIVGFDIKKEKKAEQGGKRCRADIPSLLCFLEHSQGFIWEKCMEQQLCSEGCASYPFQNPFGRH